MRIRVGAGTAWVGSWRATNALDSRDSGGEQGVCFSPASSGVGEGELVEEEGRPPMRARISEIQSPLRVDRGWKGRLLYLVVGAVGGFLLGCTLIAASGSSSSIPADAAADFRLMAEA